MTIAGETMAEILRTGTAEISSTIYLIIINKKASKITAKRDAAIVQIFV